MPSFIPLYKNLSTPPVLFFLQFLNLSSRMNYALLMYVYTVKINWRTTIQEGLL